MKDRVLIDEKRRQIVEGAILLFKKKGYHRTTVREIAREAGVGLGTIYDYFSSKDDILYLFFENYQRTFFEKIQFSGVEMEEPGARLERTYRAVVEAIMELEDQVMLAYTQAGYVKKAYLKTMLQKESGIVLHFQGILEELGTDVSESLMAANFLVFSAMFGVLRRWNLRSRYSKKEMIDFLVESQVGPFLQRGPRPTSGRRGEGTRFSLGGGETRSQQFERAPREAGPALVPGAAEQ